MKKNKILILVTLLIIFGSVTAYAWRYPTVQAPGGNIMPPITASADSQVKPGSIGVGGIGVFGSTVLKGNVKIPDGTQGQSYAFVSDANGTGSWRPLPARPINPPKEKVFSLKCAPGSRPITDRGIPFCGYVITTHATAYCNGTDERVSVADTGVGRNKGITILEPNGCTAWEGTKNYGAQACTLWCKTSGYN